MAVDTSSMFSQVIEDHLELKRRNAALEHEMPLGKYMHDDPFENHPLFKTEEQARFEDTMDGVQGIEAEETSLDWPTTERHVHRSTRCRPARPRGHRRVGSSRARRGPAFGREPLVALPRLRLGRLNPLPAPASRRLRSLVASVEPTATT